MHLTFLRRAPDGAGTDAFQSALQAGMSDVMVEAALIGSD
jgi:hypothetical protein